MSVNLRRLARTLRQIADQIEQIEINPVPRRMRFGTKLDKVVRLITRPRGATRQKILATTGCKTISVRAVANKAGLQLSKERSRNGEWRYVARPPRRAA